MIDNFKRLPFWTVYNSFHTCDKKNPEPLDRNTKTNKSYTKFIDYIKGILRDHGRSFVTQATYIYMTVCALCTLCELYRSQPQETEFDSKIDSTD